MNRYLLASVTSVLLVGATSGVAVAQSDWAYLERFRREDASLPSPAPGEDRVIFMGDSITAVLGSSFPVLFPGKPYIGRGIDGQSTPQMLVRFRQDVIALGPSVVVILGGTNDLVGATGPTTLKMIEDNLMSMVELAQANGIRPVLSSVLPVYDWNQGPDPTPDIVALNAWIKDYAATRDVVYLDYHSAMVDAQGALRRELSDDGVHPNDAGLAVMAPLIEQAITQALRRP